MESKMEPSMALFVGLGLGFRVRGDVVRILASPIIHILSPHS